MRFRASMHLTGMDMFDMRNGIVILRKDADRYVTSAMMRSYKYLPALNR